MTLPYRQRLRRRAVERPVSTAPSPVEDGARVAAPEIVVLPAEGPTLSDLFRFMRDAEMRFETLRMRVRDRTFNAAGSEAETIEVVMRHPGRAKVVTRRDADTALGHFRVWLTDGERIESYDAVDRRLSRRPPLSEVVGGTDRDLPPFARLQPKRTRLPAESIVETFVHPHNFCRNVLLSGDLTIVGTTELVDGRESYLLRCDHPRISHVLTDRPDHWLEVGIDRMTGLILLFTERVGDRITHQAEVTELELDPVVPDSAFELRTQQEVRLLY